MCVWSCWCWDSSSIMKLLELIILVFLCTASCLHPFISRAHERVWLFCAAVERSEISPTVQAAAETQAGIKVCICFQGALEQLSERHGVLSLSQPFMFSSVASFVIFCCMAVKWRSILWIQNSYKVTEGVTVWNSTFKIVWNERDLRLFERNTLIVKEEFVVCWSLLIQMWCQ